MLMLNNTSVYYDPRYEILPRRDYILIEMPLLEQKKLILSHEKKSGFYTIGGF
jgi:hypothetical protein